MKLLEYNQLDISCPACFGKGSCGTCNNGRIVCPRCRGGRWLRDNRDGSSLDKKPLPCPGCMIGSSKKGAATYSVEQEIQTIRGWLSVWAEDQRSQGYVIPEAGPGIGDLDPKKELPF